MAKTKRLYQNAAIVEIIAELHWELRPLEFAPGAKVDPFYDLFREEFVREAAKIGYPSLETIVPPEVPIELLPNKVRERLRSGPDQWPLLQIGPGVLTVNITPPYRGWAVFRESIVEALSAMIRAYPSISKFMKLSRLELHYINAFTHKHGLTDYGSFVQNSLNINAPIDRNLLEGSSSDPSRHEFSVEAFINCTRPDGATGVVKLAPGRVNHERAAVMEMIVRTDKPQKVPVLSEIVGWFDDSNRTLEALFEELTKPALKAAIGPVIEVEGAL